jgi:hypothetical protein
VSYAVRIGEVTRLPVPSFVTDSPLLAEVATYGALATELAVGVLVWNRAARPWVLALGVLLHLSIELTLAVGFFSLTIITLYLAFLPPDRAERVLLWIRDCLGRRRWWPAARSTVAGGPAVDGEPEPQGRSAPEAREPAEALPVPALVTTVAPDADRVVERGPA